MQQCMLAFVTILVHIASCYHMNQYQGDVISFAGYYLLACCTFMASITMNFYWLIQHAITKGCYAIGYYDRAIQD